MTLRTIAVAAALALGASGTGAAQTLTGAGASFPNPIYTRWFAAYYRKTGVRINYQSIGSGGGIRQFTQGTVDFGATDVPMTDAQIRAMHGNVLHVPTVLGAVVLTYNLPSLGATRLKFDGPTLADIFLGRITRWNDSRIAALNPGVWLPGLDLIVVHRSDGSGTSFIFTDFLSKCSGAWREQVGAGPSVRWPTGLGGKGNEGVTQQVRQVEGAIGYVELLYALSNDLPVAAVRNSAGNYVTPSLESVSAAGDSITWSSDTDFRVSITDAPGTRSYPVSSFTWLLIRTDDPHAARRKMIRDVLAWMLSPEAQAMAGELRYAPLPGEVLRRIRSRLEALSRERGADS